MSRAIGTFLMSVALAAAWPFSAAAQDIGACKKWTINPTAQLAPLKEGDDPNAPRPYIAKGDPNAQDPYVTLTCDSVQLFADQVEYFQGQDLMKAMGHVNFLDGTQRITADRMEFHTKTKLGTFWEAQGIMGIAGKPSPASILGATEADAYFYGERVEILAKGKYRLINGKFTTCVQPTPRWEVAAADMVIVKDRRAVMRNAVMRIKNVPVFYLPWMYYPINKGDRATGFLMPSYGNTTITGQSLSAAFFWAINRSMDATLHSQFTSKAGKGYGLDYRYVQAPGSEGSASVSVLTGSSDPTSPLASRTFRVSSFVTQALPAKLQLRGVVDYTSNIRTQQVTQQNLGQATSSTRSAAANLRGSYGRVLIDGEAGFTDVFYSATEGTRLGSLPRLGVTLSQAPIGSSKIYFGVTSEFAGIIRQTNLADPKTSRNVARLDVSPVVRTPIGHLSWLSITATAGYRFTRWSDRLNAAAEQIPVPITRQMLDLRVDVAGPTFTRIFDTPGSNYAKRWKHVFQPTFSLGKTTAFTDFNLVPKNDGVDLVFGGVTNMSYGVSNRLLAKRTTDSGVAVAQEVASIQVQQTYYTNAAAATYDTSYQSSLYGGGASKFSPVAFTASLSPVTGVSASARAEYDMTFKALRSTSAGTGITTPLFGVNATWARQDSLSKAADGLTTIKTSAYHSLTTSTSVHTLDKRFSGTWSWSYDIQRKQQLQQRYTASYLSQCCGVAMEYQVFNFGALAVGGITQDKRFNLSFSLAGIGTFANLLGAFGR